MGMLEIDNPQVTLKYSLIKLNELADMFYTLCDDLKICVYICVDAVRFH